MLPQKALHHVGAESERHSPVVFTPTTDLLLWVGPQQVTKKPSVRHVRGPHNTLDLLEVAQLWRQAAVHADDLVINDRTDWKAIEAIRERLPKLNAVAPFALIIETIYSVDRSALVVPAEQKEILRVLQLISEEETNCLEALLPSIDVVP